MKVAISYFYGIHFFRPDMIPLSTARFEPMWFCSRGVPWVDSRGVVNGLRVEQFAPSPELGESCDFQEVYRKQLEGVDCEELLDRIARLCETMRVITKFEGEPTAVFIVYETPGNPHSERAAIQEYFRKNGVACEEVDPEELKG